MAKKRQHYVPQFYLRAFASGSSGKQIGLYHLPSDKYVRTAPIRTQAYENNFYGRVEIENALSIIESEAAEVIERIIRQEGMPPRLSHEHYALAIFVLFQRLRTAYAVDSLEESNDKTMKIIASHDPGLKDRLGGGAMRLDNAPAFCLQMAAEMYPLMLDLRYKLLCNQTPQPFITSDHPVVFYNQYLERRNAFGGRTGMACLGLQIFLPLGPKHQVVFFDPQVYKVGGRKLRNTRVDIVLPDDVETLNVLQVANANEHIYFNDAMQIATLRKIIQEGDRFRRSEKVRVCEYEGGTDEAGRHHSLLVNEPVDLRMRLKLRCITVPECAMKLDLGNSAAHVRDSEICKLHLRFMGEVDSGKYKRREFSRFLRDQERLIGPVARYVAAFPD